MVMGQRLLRHHINSDEREKYIKANSITSKALTFCSKLFPDYNDFVIMHPNTKRLIEILREYNSYDTNGRRKAIVNAVLRIVISKIEHSPNWRDPFCWWVDRLRSGGWKGCSYNHPVNNWDEPKPCGGRI